MKRKNIVLIIVSLILIFVIYKITSNTAPKESRVDSVIEETSGDNNEVKSSTESFITKTSDSNINIYTSPKLGISFKYAVVDPIDKKTNEVIENGSTIKIRLSENQNNNYGGSITVFNKDSKMSLKDSIKKDFSVKNCNVVISNTNWNLDTQASLAFNDMKNVKGEPVYLSSAGDYSNLSNKDRECSNEVNNAKHAFDYFLASSKVKNKYIAVSVSSQSVDAVLLSDVSTGNITQWMSTVDFID